LVVLVAVPVNVVRARASAAANVEVVSALRPQQAVAGEVTGGTVSGISGDVAANVRGGARGGVAKVAEPMPSPDPDVDVAPPGAPPAPPVAQQPVRVGGNIAPPERIKYVQPAYPQAAKDAHVSGIVIAEIVVDETGKVTDATLLRSIHLLDEAVLDAVKQWRYRPTMLNGQAVPVIMTVTVNFALADGTVGVGAPARSQGLSVSFSAPVDEPTLWNGREVMKVGGAVKAPERVRYVAPVYPQEAQAARVMGIVIIQAVIDETGRVVATKVLRSIALLDDAAMDAVRQWEYTPTFLDGVAIPVLMTVTVNFTVQGQK
jgi:TonB family protein